MLVRIEALCRRSPRDPRALHTMGLLLEAAGREQEAVVWYERAAKLAPGDAIVAGSLETSADRRAMRQEQFFASRSSQRSASSPPSPSAQLSSRSAERRPAGAPMPARLSDEGRLPEPEPERTGHTLDGERLAVAQRSSSPVEPSADDLRGHLADDSADELADHRSLAQPLALPPIKLNSHARSAPPRQGDGSSHPDRAAPVGPLLITAGDEAEQPAAAPGESHLGPLAGPKRARLALLNGGPAAARPVLRISLDPATAPAGDRAIQAGLEQTEAAASAPNETLVAHDEALAAEPETSAEADGSPVAEAATREASGDEAPVAKLMAPRRLEPVESPNGGLRLVAPPHASSSPAIDLPAPAATSSEGTRDVSPTALSRSEAQTPSSVASSAEIIPAAPRASSAGLRLPPSEHSAPRVPLRSEPSRLNGDDPSPQHRAQELPESVTIRPAAPEVRRPDAPPRAAMATPPSPGRSSEPAARTASPSHSAIPSAVAPRSPAESPAAAGGTSTAARRLLDRGGEALRRHDVAAAADLFRQAAQRQSQDPEASLEAAVLCLQHDQPRLAADLLSESARRFPDSPRIFRAWGTACYRMRDYATAERLLRRAVSLDNSSGLSYLLLGGTLQKQGKTGEAEDSFRTALALDPSLAQRR